MNTLLTDSADVTPDETSSGDASDSCESKTKLKDSYDEDEQKLKEYHKLVICTPCECIRVSVAVCPHVCAWMFAC